MGSGAPTPPGIGLEQAHQENTAEYHGKASQGGQRKVAHARPRFQRTIPERYPTAIDKRWRNLATQGGNRVRQLCCASRPRIQESLGLATTEPAQLGRSFGIFHPFGQRI